MFLAAAPAPRAHFFGFAPRTLVLLIVLGWAGLEPALAQQAAEASATLKPVVVSGSRSEQDPDELPMSVDVIDARTIEDRQMGDIRDVAADLPNVSMPRAPARFTIGSQTGRDQNAGFNIRGLEGNRVLMLVDGIRQPRSYVFPSESAVGRDYIDLSLVKRIEIVRGATSALYGSDGVAGLVNFITKDPADYLRGGKSIGGSAGAGFGGDSNTLRLGATLAGHASDSLDWLLSVGGSQGHALENKGANDSADVRRTTPNPEDARGASLLGKLVFTPSGTQRHVLTLEHVERSTDYDLLSNVAVPPYASTSVVASNGRTDMERNRLSWDGRWQLGAAWVDELRAVLSFQDSQSTEYFFQDRFTAADRSRNTDYSERAVQGNLQASKALRLGGDVVHKLVYGLDLSRTQVENLQTGVTPPAGESYPLKRFPDTTESSSALYLHDEIVMGNWSLVPGVRIDHFSIDADQAGYAGRAVSTSGSAVSPKLGALYRFNPHWTGYGSFAAGFKAPTAGQVNGYFTNLAFGYQSIANPDLRPEKSRNFEVGVRGRFENVSLDVAAFTGRYKDFIEDFQSVGTVGGLLTYQSINLSNVTLSGIETKGSVDWGQFAGGRLSTPFAFGYTRGRNTDTHTGINSVVPAKLSIGARYESTQWGAGLQATHYAAKKRADLDTGATPNNFLSPSATLLDATVQLRIRRDLRITAGVYNLTDRKYWRWSDVVGQASGSATIDAYTQPGRYARLSIVKDF